MNPANANSFLIRPVFTGSKRLIPAGLITLLLSFFSFSLAAQDSTFQSDQLVPDSMRKTNLVKAEFYTIKAHTIIPDPLLSPLQKRRRTWIIGGTNVLGYGGTMIGLYHSWYKNYPQSKFHTFNDWPEWKQVDKIGHLYSAYIESYGSMKMWQWTGMDRKKRIWIGGMSGAVYQTAIEVLDGFSTGWGWSWGDFSANMLGSGALVAQELAWDEQRIKLKFSFHKKNYNDPELNQRSDKLFGNSLAERMLKDYNGQTYWASANLKSFFKNSRLPAWLSVSVGYGAEGLFGGTENIGKDENGNIIFIRPDIKRYRQWFLAPDIDLTKIKTNKKGLKFLFTVLSAFKFPTPSLELGNGRIRFHAIHF